MSSTGNFFNRRHGGTEEKPAKENNAYGSEKCQSALSRQQQKYRKGVGAERLQNPQTWFELGFYKTKSAINLTWKDQKIKENQQLPPRLEDPGHQKIKENSPQQARIGGRRGRKATYEPLPPNANIDKGGGIEG